MEFLVWRIKTNPECCFAETAKGCDMDTLYNEEAASPPGKYCARPINRIGSSPRAVSNQRKGSRVPAQPLNQPRGFEPGTSSFKGGRFAHCATWTPFGVSFTFVNFKDETIDLCALFSCLRLLLQCLAIKSKRLLAFVKNYGSGICISN